MRPLMLLMAVVGFTFFSGDAKAARDDAAYPTVARDQKRPAAPVQGRPGTVTSDLQNDPCSIAPEWCGGDPTMSGGTCPNLCTSKSCGTKLGDQKCLKDMTTGAALYYCVNAAGRSCDTYTYSNNVFVCATCV